MRIRRYSELRQLKTFEDRFNYLKLDGSVGADTFGFDRYMNQMFYKSTEWKQLRQKIILRDNACDLGIDDYSINGRILIHHMNPIGPADIIDATEYLLNPEYLISVSFETHNAIHYGGFDSIPMSRDPIIRKPFDTCPWRN